jgi:cytochrome c oxidase subunit III
MTPYLESESVVKPEANKTMGMNPLKFALWLFIVSFVMIFASLTSAYIVKRSDGNWLEFELPQMFTINTVLLLISSITMHFSLISARKDNLIAMKVGLVLTLALGMAFLFGQVAAWNELVEMKVFLVGNAAGSFIYIISGLHGAHIIGGLVFVLIVLGLSFRNEIHQKKILWIEMCTTFWHFLDGLWLYLFFFLILNR